MKILELRTVRHPITERLTIFAVIEMTDKAKGFFKADCDDDTFEGFIQAMREGEIEIGKVVKNVEASEKSVQDLINNAFSKTILDNESE